jgi:chromosome segregation ATPase
METMDDKNNLFKHIKTLKMQFALFLENLRSWIQATDIALENLSHTPEDRQQLILKISDEYNSLQEQLNGFLTETPRLVENSQTLAEKNEINNNLLNATDQLNSIHKKIQDLYVNVTKALELKQQFYFIHKEIIEWTNSAQVFLKKPLECGSLFDIQNKCSEYSVSCAIFLIHMVQFTFFVSDVGSHPRAINNLGISVSLSL